MRRRSGGDPGAFQFSAYNWYIRSVTKGAPRRLRRAMQNTGRRRTGIDSRVRGSLSGAVCNDPCVDGLASLTSVTLAAGDGGWLRTSVHRGEVIRAGLG